MEAIIVHQRNPNIMYLFEPLRSCTIALYIWMVDLVTSHGLAIFCIFNFTNRLHLASGPHKGILLGGPLVTRWSSSLGHGLSPNKHLHDLPFWASHFMYIAVTFVTYHGLQNWKLSCFGPYNCKNCTWFERLKKVHHVRVPIGGQTGL